MWHLRQQVGAFVSEAKDKTRSEDELQSKFVEPTGIRSADIRTTCLTWTWAELQEQIAKVLLFDLCSLFESWLDDVVPRALPPGTDKKLVEQRIKGVQFPTTYAGGVPTDGFRKNLTLITATKSALTETDFFPILKRNKKNSWGMMDPMLTVYRYFKECRNKIIHRGGIADKKAVDAYSDARAVDHKDVGLAGAMVMPPVTKDDPIRLVLPDVVALSSIIHRMIVTMDAAFSVSQGAERDMIERIRESRNKGRKVAMKPPEKRSRAIKSLVRCAGLPEPLATVRLEQALANGGII
jgi:hypothetical protein